MQTPDPTRRLALSLEQYVEGVQRGDRAILGRAISLVESRAEAHTELAQALLERLLPSTGGARRVGITGVPGVGKSTFIEALGKKLTREGHQVAVLAVDPSSGRTRGSILGDKTRMVQLAQDPNAFIRPTPSGGTLGGVGRKTRETLLLCEAAGFDVVLVETVGVGQSETVVAELVDHLLVLMLAGAGDELQGIKRGILELADLVAINKADGDNAESAARASREYAHALALLRPGRGGPEVPVLTCSGLSGRGLDELWQQLEQLRGEATRSGALAQKRRTQQRRWLWQLVEGELVRALREHPEVSRCAPALEVGVEQGTVPVTAAAQRLLALFGHPSARG